MAGKSKYAEDIEALSAGMATLLERSANTLAQLKKLNGRVSVIDRQVDTNCIDITRLQEKQGPLSIISTGISTGISSGIALLGAWFFGTHK